MRWDPSFRINQKELNEAIVNEKEKKEKEKKKKKENRQIRIYKPSHTYMNSVIIIIIIINSE